MLSDTAWTTTSLKKKKSETPAKTSISTTRTMSSSYKAEEKSLKKIIQVNVKPVEPTAELKLIIYYKTRRTWSLIIKNSCQPPVPPLQDVSLVYKFTCKNGDCSHRPSLYIGSTITTLSKRMTTHLRTRRSHQAPLPRQAQPIISRKYIEENITTLYKEKDANRLRMAESVYINSVKPAINIQLLPTSCQPSQRRIATNSEEDQRALWLVHVLAYASPSYIRPWRTYTAPLTHVLLTKKLFTLTVFPVTFPSFTPLLFAASFLRRCEVCGWLLGPYRHGTCPLWLVAVFLMCLVWSRLAWLPLSWSLSPSLRQSETFTQNASISTHLTNLKTHYLAPGLSPSEFTLLLKFPSFQPLILPSIPTSPSPSFLYFSYAYSCPSLLSWRWSKRDRKISREDKQHPPVVTKREF